ncbi:MULTISPECIES: YfiT family bacillithiol transferase [Gaetbulibacter]|uniref:YfiT family bacillithiol transferase n=1 Tax=Gaetbulibacter TaxID=311207 RepID=UPI0021D2B616|nr:putative metal-dependent hydrolase [Gaetbulibacter sp. NE]
MTTEALQKLKYPIGTFKKPELITQDHITSWINDIEQLPSTLEALTKNLTKEELNWVYRPDGWTIKQVVHHCGDSHLNSIIRFKLALTEDAPTIKPYLENRWAELPDSTDDDLSNSITLLKGIHSKLAKLLKSLNNEELKREFIHPEHGKRFSLEETIGIYAWHSNHHTAHIKQALTHKGEF